MLYQSIHGTSIMKGLLSRVSGTNGFQLVNVTNAPIQLQPFIFQNRLLNMVGNLDMCRNDMATWK